MVVTVIININRRINMDLDVLKITSQSITEHTNKCGNLRQENLKSVVP